VIMGFELLDAGTARSSLTAIRRIVALGVHWRVTAEAWPGGDGWSGRLIFSPDHPAPAVEPRQGPVILHGRNRLEILAAAHDISEQRLRALLHSLA